MANISEKIKEVRLRWLGHVDRKTVRRCSNENMEDGGLRKIGRPKLGWSDVIRKYMNEKQVKIEDAQELKNVEIENLMRRYQIGKRPNKKRLLQVHIK